MGADVNLASPPGEGAAARDAARTAPVRLLLISLALAVVPAPIVLVAKAGVELAPADFVAPVLLIVALVTRRSRAGDPPPKFLRTLSTLFWILALLGLVAMLAASRDAGSESGSLAKQLGSLLFILRPFLYFYAGVAVAARFSTNLRSPILPLGVSAAFGCSIILAGLLLNSEQNYQYGFVDYGGALMYGEHLGGSYLGLPLYGRFGVNSLAETYVVYAAVSFAALAYLWGMNRANRTFGGTPIRTILLASGTVAGAYLAWTSQSRQAQIGVILVLAVPVGVLILMRMLRVNHSRLFGALLLMGLGLGVVLAIARGVGSTESLNAYASGRLDIAKYGWREVLSHPFTGSGFTESASHAFNAHNILLNVGYKMGLVGAICYLAILSCISIPSVKRLLLWRSVPPDLWIVDVTWMVMVVVIGLISNAMDVVTASGPLLFLIGVYATTCPKQEMSEIARGGSR